MVRSLATIDDVLRSFANWLPRQRSMLSDSALGRLVVGLVVLFFGMATFGAFFQFTHTRAEQLELASAELLSNARAALREVQTNIAANNSGATDIPFSTAFAPQELGATKFHFLLVDTTGFARYTVETTEKNVNAGLPINQIFALEDSFIHLKNTIGEVRQQTLTDSTPVLALMLPLIHTEFFLLTYRPVDAALALWRNQIFIFIAFLLCAFAIIFGLTLAYYEQKQHSLLHLSNLTMMNKGVETALQIGGAALWEWQIGVSEPVFSSSVLRLLGLDIKFPLNRHTFLDYLHPNDADPFLFLEKNQSENHPICETSFRVKHFQKGWIWLKMRAELRVPSTAGLKQALVFFFDVTQEYNNREAALQKIQQKMDAQNLTRDLQRASEIEMHQADARLRDAIETISEAFVLWDENNRLVMCNSKYQKFYALDSTLVKRGVAYETLMAAARHPSVIVKVDRGSHPENRERFYEAKFLDGSWLQVNERHTKDGGYVSVGTDITAHKIQEQRLIATQNELRHAVSDLGKSKESLHLKTIEIEELADRYHEQKLQAVTVNRLKAEFLANMNHEIRTPLTHIMGFAEIIEKEIFGKCECRRYVEYAQDIRKSGKNLLSLISDVSEMACLETGRISLKRSEISLQQLFEQALQNVQTAIEMKGVTLNLESIKNEEINNKRLYLDEKLVVQAFSHLLRTSLRLTPQNGEIIIKARLRGDAVNIFIVDPHSTLSLEDVNKILDPFGHIDGLLEDGCKGSGLGPAIARAFIELHGGRMRMRAGARSGTIVVIHLPIGKTLM